MQLSLFQKSQLNIEENVEKLEEIAEYLRYKTLITIQSARTGHLGACMSSLELLTVLYFGNILQYNPKNSKDEARDYVLGRGHRGPLRYNIFALLGWLEDEEMDKYRLYGSRLQGHEDMNITPGVDLTPSGSLGMLLSYAVGARTELAKKGMNNTMYCFLGDGEEQEGNISEAARSASALKTTNLIVIIDQNGKQLSTQSNQVDGGSDIQKIREGYGWEVLITDGHDIERVLHTYQKAIKIAHQKPVCIIAKTIKGNTISGSTQHYTGYHVYHDTHQDKNHSTMLAPLDSALESLKSHISTKEQIVKNIKELLTGTTCFGNTTGETIGFSSIHPTKESGDSYEYLDEFLASLEKQKGLDVRILTADYPPRRLISNGQFKFAGLDYTNIGIREQHMFAMAHGICSVNKNVKVIILCGDPFLYRSADQINVLDQSQDNVIIYSVQAGLSGAQNGSTHQSSGQPGFIASLPHTAFYEPASKEDRFDIMNSAMTTAGPVYIRTHLGNTQYQYTKHNKQGGNYKTTFGDKPQATLIGCGMTAQEVITAANILHETYNIGTDVVIINNHNSYDDVCKDINTTLPSLLYYNGNPKMVASGLSHSLLSLGKNVRIESTGFTLGTTGKISDVMKHFGLDSDSIINKVKSFIP